MLPMGVNWPRKAVNSPESEVEKTAPSINEKGKGKVEAPACSEGEEEVTSEHEVTEDEAHGGKASSELALPADSGQIDAKHESQATTDAVSDMLSESEVRSTAAFRVYRADGQTKSVPPTTTLTAKAAKKRGRRPVSWQALYRSLHADKAKAHWYSRSGSSEGVSSKLI